MSFIISGPDYEAQKKLAELVRKLNSEGHNPATSGNYSLRSKTNPEFALVSESGIDKSLFNEENFLPVLIETREMDPSYFVSGRRSSDETDIHLSLYEITKAQCVLHSHMLSALLFADLYQNSAMASITGLELIKAFKGMKTHEENLIIPLFENTQNIKELSEKIKPALIDTHTYGIILRGHGIYVWGDSVFSAKRHLEAFEYLFNYTLASRK